MFLEYMHIPWNVMKVPNIQMCEKSLMLADLELKRECYHRMGF